MTVSTPAAALWLRDVILDGLSNAVSYQQDKYAFCRDCAGTPGGHCLDHERAYGLALEFEEAAVLVRLAGSGGDMPGELLAILHGTDGRTP
jgi:hypothetical protein